METEAFKVNQNVSQNFEISKFVCILVVAVRALFRQ